MIVAFDFGDIQQAPVWVMSDGRPMVISSARLRTRAAIQGAMADLRISDRLDPESLGALWRANRNEG